MLRPTALDIARAALGIADLVPAVARLEVGHELDHAERVVYRILSARQLVQAVGTAALPVRRLGVAVDVIHSVSMLGVLALGHPRFRRAAGIQAAIAAGLAIWGVVEDRRS